MRRVAHSPSGAAATALILETFRFNGALLAAGDRLTADLGLTSARWQVLGAIADGPLTVAAAGRRMGLTRQAVQRLANELVADGFAGFYQNPDHKRAMLLGLTPKGAKAYAELTARQAEWSNRLASGLPVRRLKEAAAVLSRLRSLLEKP